MSNMRDLIRQRGSKPEVCSSIERIPLGEEYSCVGTARYRELVPWKDFDPSGTFIIIQLAPVCRGERYVLESSKSPWSATMKMYSQLGPTRDLPKVTGFSRVQGRYTAKGCCSKVPHSPDKISYRFLSALFVLLLFKHLAIQGSKLTACLFVEWSMLKVATEKTALKEMFSLFFFVPPQKNQSRLNSQRDSGLLRPLLSSRQFP
jgi:hypothetical protein